MLKIQQGFIQNLILPSLILMGIVIAGLSATLNVNQTGQSIGRSVDEARTQLEKIRTALNWCVVLYPNGNNLLAGPKPSLPGSPVGGAWIDVRDAICPGVPSITLWLAAHDQLNKPGQYLAEWSYRYVPSGATSGVYLRLSVANAGDVTGQAVLSQVASRLPPDQKVLSGDTLEIVFIK